MFRYPTPDDAPGAGYAMVTDRFALLLGAGAGDGLAAAVWETMTARDAAFEDVLSVIAAVGIGSLPDFALVELVDAGSSAVSVAVRGAATIDLHGPQRSSYTGRGVGTWVEGSAQHVAGISLGLGAAPGHALLPIGRGVVRSDALAWGASAPAAAVPAPAAAPAAAAHADLDPLETVAVDRRTLSEALGPRRRSRAEADHRDAVAADAAAPPAPPTLDVDDSTVLGSRRPGPAVAAAPAARRYVLRLEPGGELPLDHPVVLGRAPRAAEHPGARIVNVTSPRKEVSSTHVEVRLDGDLLVVSDLGSTNGTIVRDATGEMALLRGGASARVSPGAVLDLGDGILAAFEPSP